MELKYSSIQGQLTAALPEIAPAAERYWRVEGKPGEDCGPYIFFECMFATYVNVLLVMNSSPRRDHLLSRAFGFVEKMLASSDLEVANLAYVGLLEWQAPWWYAQAGPYIGLHARACLDRFFSEWRTSVSSGEQPAEHDKSAIIDLYGVRSVIASELAADGVRLEDIPGVTHLGS